MSSYIRITADAQGRAHLTDVELTLRPGLGDLATSVRLAVSEAVVFEAPAGGGHPEQPESRRQLAVVLAGSCTVTASGQTRTCRAGDLLLVEDTVGTGHSSRSEEGATILLVALEDGADW